MSFTLSSALIRSEEDVVRVRRQVRQIALALGFDANDQTRVAAAVSEIARNAFLYAGGGEVKFLCDIETGWFTIRVSDSGRGIADLPRVLRGDFQSATGMGMGLIGAQRLMDDFQVTSEIGKGTVVKLGKRLTVKAPANSQQLAKVAQAIAVSAPRDLMDEIRHENRELLRVMDELRARQEDLVRLNGELEHTNRGVVALYGELDDKAEKLRRADVMKSRFLSHMSHEFRTPLTSIMALSRLLIDEMDGTLTVEQRKQASFIRKSAESLLEMVNDLLDLARVEAGKTVVRPARFTVSNLFAALQGVLKPLRGVIRPLAAVEDVELIFEDASGLPQIYTDETKVTQILRNFVSNALKFTERGEVRVRAELAPNRKRVVFSVADTGQGIPQAHLETIFQEFAQVDSPMQKKVTGSGLGLPLARALAQVLGGDVRVESSEGKGSTFYAEIPLEYAEEPAVAASSESAAEVLLIDDEEVSRYLVRQALGSSVTSMEASDGASGIEMARERQPRAILLDLRMPQMNGFEILRELKADPATTRIPVTIMTAQALTNEERATLEEHAAAVLSKEILSQPGGAERLRNALLGEGGAR